MIEINSIVCIFSKVSGLSYGLKQIWASYFDEFEIFSGPFILDDLVAVLEIMVTSDSISCVND